MVLYISSVAKPCSIVVVEYPSYKSPLALLRYANDNKTSFFHLSVPAIQRR